MEINVNPTRWLISTQHRLREEVVAVDVAQRVEMGEVELVGHDIDSRARLYAGLVKDLGDARRRRCLVHLRWTILANCNLVAAAAVNDGRDASLRERPKAVHNGGHSAEDLVARDEARHEPMMANESRHVGQPTKKVEPIWDAVDGRRGSASKEPRDRVLRVGNRAVVVTKTLVLCLHELGELGVRHVGHAGRERALAYRLAPHFDAERRSFKRDEVAPSVKKEGPVKMWFRVSDGGPSSTARPRPSPSARIARRFDIWWFSPLRAAFL